MPYLVRLKNPSGHKVGEFGPFPSQAAAKMQAQVFADQAAPGVSVFVEKAPTRKKNPKPGLRERMRRVGERGFTVVEGVERRLGRVGGQYVGLSDDETDRAVAEMQAARRELVGVKAAARRRAKRNPAAWLRKDCLDREDGSTKNITIGTRVKVIRDCKGKDGWTMVGKGATGTVVGATSGNEASKRQAKAVLGTTSALRVDLDAGWRSFLPKWTSAHTPKGNPSHAEHMRSARKMTHMIEAAVELGDVPGMQFYRGARAAHEGDPRVNRGGKKRR